MASIFTDFTNGLASANDYLDTRHHLKTELTGSVADSARVVVSAKYDTTLKEIICNLMAGRGLKLPNIQICIDANLTKLLGLPNLQEALIAPLTNLSNSMTNFIDHTKIDNVLGRINNVVAEATNIANMINFCSTPIDPIAIPNLLEQSMQSFLGAGKEIIDKLGTMASGEISGCISNDGFNCNAFTGGILGTLAANCSDLNAGTLADDIIESIVAEADKVKNEIDTLIESELNLSGLYSQGGSDFTGIPVPVNEDLGVLHNADDAGIQGNTRIASQLKSLYDNLGSYQVVSKDGTVYNNIFELFVDDELLSLLRDQVEPTTDVIDKIPVYNYCGEIVGYTENVIQEEEKTSAGFAPLPTDQPGYNAGGIDTNEANNISPGSLSPSDSPTFVNLNLSGDTINVATQKTPATATSIGIKGDIVHDANYIYICTATNTWKRAALSTW